MPNKLRVFVDANVIIAGFASQAGASSVIRDLAEAGLIGMVVNEQVIVEADRNIEVKLPRLLDRFRQFVKVLGPEVAFEAPPELIRRVETWIHVKDAPIMASAMNAQVDYLVTLDARDFFTSQVKTHAPFPVLTPGKFLKIFRALLD